MGDNRPVQMSEMGDGPSAVKEKETLLAEDETDPMVVVVGDEKKVPFSKFDEEVPVEKAPKDRFLLVYIVLIIHGIGVLMPWNMFITAEEYFVKYKLKETCYNITLNCGQESDTKTVYQDHFLRSLCMVAQIPNVLLNGINLFCQVKSGNTSIRIIACILTIIGVFSFTVLLAILDSSDWPAAFFWITMVTVVIINSANGIYQNSVYGLAACLPMKYTNAVIIGSNTCGVVTAIIAVIAKLSAPNPRLSAIFYFMTAIVVLGIALTTFVLLRKNRFYRYYADKAASEKSGNAVTSSTREYLMQYWAVFKKCWKEDLCVFFVFFVTLFCFPTIQADVKPLKNSSFFIGEEWFTMITCFVIFNVFAMLGSLITLVCTKPGPDWIWLPIAMRGLFIPFFLFCNFRPIERKWPVLFANEYIYCIGCIFMALTNGYFSSLAMMFAPRKVEAEKKGIAGMMAAFSLILGIFFGILFTNPMIWLVDNVGSYGITHNVTSVSPVINTTPDLLHSTMSL